MKVAFLWTNISGYMTACWRALDSMDDIEVSICAFRPGEMAPFTAEMVAGLNHRLLDSRERKNSNMWRRYIDNAQADIYVICGWGTTAFASLSEYVHSRGAKAIVVLDTPFEGRWHQYLTRFKYRKLFAHTDMFVVTGERSYQYALRLKSGVPVRRGLYGVDYARLSQAYDYRSSSRWPKKFLFVGRYAEVKNINVLVAAYLDYRNTVDSPWPLICCGTGPESEQLDGIPGLDNRGFCQPEEVINIMRESGVFVLPSRFDPWPLVIVEACAAGLPIICSQACGSAVENVRDYYNGIFVQTGSKQDLAYSMRWMHHNHRVLDQWGKRGQELARAYSAEAWAERWHRWLLQLIGVENNQR